MKFGGVLRILLFLGLDFYVLYQLVEIKTTFLITVLIVLIGWLGEYIDVLRSCGIQVEKASTYEKMKLTNAYNRLADKIFDVEGRKIGKVRLYVIPDDNASAFSYGFCCIGVTSGLLKNVDDITLCAVLAREISHKINLDAVFKRIVFVNMIIMMAVLSIGAIFSSIIVWIVFFILGLFKICGGRYFSYWVTSGISKTFKGLFSIVQRMFVFVFKASIGFVSRYSEYKADNYSARLGYVQQLQYFIRRFEAEINQQRPRTFTDILYDTKPLPSKRIAKLEQYRMQFSVG